MKQYTQRIPLRFLYVIMLTTILPICFSIQTLEMNKNVLATLKVEQDYVHHFVFFDQAVLDSLQRDLEIFSEQIDVKFYLNNCDNNKMHECENSQKVPLMLLFNRIFIRYNGDPKNQTEIIEWMGNRIQKVPEIISSYDQLTEQLKKTPELFTFCDNPKAPAEKAMFYSLAKAVYFPDFAWIDNKQLIESLNLTEGNITLMKETPENRVEFQMKNRYDMWEYFVKMHAIGHLQRVNPLIQLRFQQKNKTQDAIIVVCDFSSRCEKFWNNFNVWSRQFKTNHPQIDLRPDFFDQKVHNMYIIYFHLIINQTKLPALVNIKMISNNEKAGQLQRYLQYPQQSIDAQTILKFNSDVNQGKIQAVYMSGDIPKKNGFYGKASEKLIQKLVTDNLNETIRDSEKHYVLLITAFGIGCAQCQSFYSQFKKAASFFVDEEITFGMLHLIQNQVNIEEVASVPQILLFNKYHKDDPVRMENRHSFDALFKFLQLNSIVSGNDYL